MLKTEQKQQILELRKKGYGYKSIASILQIKMDSVRNLCKSHGLVGYGQPVNNKTVEESATIKNCLNCGKELNTEDKRGRKPMFCCETCRRTWWKNNDDKKNKRDSAWYSFHCKNCGKEFKVYGNKNRKYCSIKCSIDYRFSSTT